MVDAVIRLFESTAITFVSNGLGYLSDAMSCEVTEERNGSFELQMVYPITGKLYSELLTRRLVVAKSNPFSNPQPFRIYDISKPINGKVTVYAEHISYDLSGIPVRPFSASNVVSALKGLKDNAMIPCSFNFLTDKTTEANYGFETPTNIRSELGGVEGSILDTYRGEYEFDRFEVHLWNNRGMNRGVSIRYGKNMTDLNQEENISDLYTGVLPYWYSDYDENGGLVQGNIVNCPGTYNFQKILVLDCSYEFQDKPTVEKLTSFAQSYISNNGVGVPKVSISVSFVDFSSSEEYQNVASLMTVHLCDIVTVEYPELGVKATGKCIKTKYNVLEDRYNSIEIGDAKTTLSSTITSNNDKLAEDFQKKLISTTDTTREELEKSLNNTYTELVGDITALGESSNEADKQIQKELAQTDADLKKLIKETAENEATAREEAIANSTKLITGNLGGYVILHSSTNADYPDEILVMDTPDIKTTKKIWRWNKSGLGYSNTGYNGPYGLAITQDGSIVADYVKVGALNASLITTGHMSASIIQGGTLILGGTNNGNGTFILRDNSNNTIGLMNNAGLSIYKGTISGPTITIGGRNNQNGVLTVLDSSGNQLGGWNNSGIQLTQDGSIFLDGYISYGGVAEVPGATLISGTAITQSRKLGDSKFEMVYAQRGFSGANVIPGSITTIVTGYSFYSAEEYFLFGKLLVSSDKTSVNNVFGISLSSNNPSILYTDLYVGPPYPMRSTGATIKFGGGRYSCDIITEYGDSGHIYPKLNFATSEFGCRFTSKDGGYAPVEASAFNIGSSIRYKKNILDLEKSEAEKILNIRTVTFDYVDERPNGQDQKGVIAEEVYNIIPSVVSLDVEKKPNSVDYSKFIPYLIKMIQIQQKEIEELKQK